MSLDATTAAMELEERQNNKRLRTNNEDSASEDDAPQQQQQQQQQQQPDKVIEEALASARRVILKVLEGQKDIWDELSEYWKNDAEVALAALIRYHDECKGNKVNLCDIPECFRNNKDFLLKAVAKRSELWYQLPSQFENDIEFVYVLPDYFHSPPELVGEIVERFPKARSDRKLWEKIIDQAAERQDVVDSWNFYSVIRRFSADNIRADPDLMSKACLTELDCFKLVHPSLFESRDFVKLILQAFDSAEVLILKYIPHDAQIRWPDLVMESFEKMAWNMLAQIDYVCDSSTSWEDHVACVAPALWTDGDRVKYAWFQAGFPFVKESFPTEWREDRRIFLLIAENCKDPLDSFEAMFSSLCESKEFMLQLVELNPRALETALGTLATDFDVIIMAVANRERCKPHGSYGDVERHFLTYSDYRSDAHGFFGILRTYIQEKLHVHAVMTKLVLPAIKFGGASSSLSLLNQGSETSKAYVECIAEYTGVPIGKELRLLRKALPNLPSPEHVRSLSAVNERERFWAQHVGYSD